MDLVERYLQAVRFFLPRNQQDDIMRELSENLMSEIEDRQDELGRALDEREQVDILRRHGHPMLVGGRYRSRQQLIGPVVFPIYIVVLPVAVAVTLLASAIPASVMAALHGEPLRQALQALLAFPLRALIVFGATTLAFAALDIVQSRVTLIHEWDPRKLPKVMRPDYQIPRAGTACELLLVSACLVWLLLARRAPYLILGPASAFLAAAPIWRVVYVPIVFLTLATAALHAVNFVRPYWTKSRSVMRMAISGASFVLFVVLVNAGEWFVRAPAAAVPNGLRADRMLDLVNAGCKIGLAVAAVITVGEIVREVYRLRNRRNASLPYGPAPARAAR